jgi:hypothetical protein
MECFAVKKGGPAFLLCEKSGSGRKKMMIVPICLFMVGMVVAIKLRKRAVCPGAWG